jgi:hypothetical protein
MHKQGRAHGSFAHPKALTAGERRTFLGVIDIRRLPLFAYGFENQKRGKGLSLKRLTATMEKTKNATPQL